MTTSDAAQSCAALRGAGLRCGVKNVPVLLVTCTSRAMNRPASASSLSLRCTTDEAIADAVDASAV